MTVTVSTAADLRAALADIARAKVGTAVTRAQTAIVGYCVEEWELGKATWSPKQPNDFWSGQYRASLRVSPGQPDPSYEPDNPGPWPIHNHPYPALVGAEVMNMLAGIEPFQVVYLSDNAPHAQKVEDHTKIATAAAEFTRAHFVGYDWGGQLDIGSDIPF